MLTREGAEGKTPSTGLPARPRSKKTPDRHWSRDGRADFRPGPSRPGPSGGRLVLLVIKGCPKSHERKSRLHEGNRIKMGNRRRALQLEAASQPPPRAL